MFTDPAVLSIGGATVGPLLRALQLQITPAYAPAIDYETGLPFSRIMYGVEAMFSFVAWDVPNAVINAAFGSFASGGVVTMPNSPSSQVGLDTSPGVEVSAVSATKTLTIPNGVIEYIGPVTHSHDIWKNGAREIIVRAYGGTSGNAFTY